MSIIPKTTAAAIAQYLPSPVKTHIKDHYIASYRDALIETFFESDRQYEALCEEFGTKQIFDRRDELLREYYPDRDSFGGINATVARRLYALVRALEPKTLVETGVHHGVSTFVLLAALEENGHGTLESIDYPFHATTSVEAFREETYADFGGSAPLPPDKDPGWIIPDRLRDRWHLHVGKIQRELPPLLTEVDAIDLYLRDSEHSLPCMLFEFEAAWEWLAPGGVIVSDDVHHTEAFDAFVAARDTENGRLTPAVGYLHKPSS